MLLFVSTPPPASMPLKTRWSRDLLFHLAGLLTANVGLVLWVTGVSLSAGLAITFFGLIVALGTLLGCRWFARVERRRAGSSWARRSLSAIRRCWTGAGRRACTG